MKKMFFGLTILLGATFLAGSVFAQPSAKSTAQVSNIAVLKQVGTTAASVDDWSTILSSTLKTAEPSDLFIDVSLECGLYTDTTVKSKGGARDTSTATAGVRVKVLVDGKEALPGEVTFCSREQELSAVFQGIFQGPNACVDPVSGQIDYTCLADNCLTVDPNTGTIVIDETCLAPEELSLALRTMNANAFNFLVPDVGVGEHKVEVQTQLSSNSEAQSGSASANALVGKGSVAVEEVKMIQGENVIQ